MRLEPHRLVFIDETGTNTKMTRARGRCERGERLRSKAPFGHWKTQTFVAGLRCGALTAPWVIDAPMDRAIFETYVRTQLVPTLQAGDIVILDNLPAHKSPAAEQAIRQQGARSFVCECHTISTMPRFQPPPRRTQRADFLALRSPACFAPRLMGPILPERLSGLAAPLGSR